MAWLAEQIKRIGRPADAIQMAVYAWAVLTFVATPVLTYLKVVSAESSSEAWFQGILVVVIGTLVALVPVIFRPRKRVAEGEFLNGLFRQESIEARVVVKPDGSVTRTTERLVAVGSTNRIAVSSRVTGHCNVARVLHSAGTLKGPVEDVEKTRWEVILQRFLAAGEPYTLELSMIVEDPERTMRPFYALGTRGYSSRGSAAITITFEGWKPHRVTQHVEGLVGGVALTPAEDLFLDENNVGYWNIPALQAGRRYVIQWSPPPAVASKS